jgi:hypothetical protein
VTEGNPLPWGAHFFVDESKSKAYYLAASIVAPGDLASARRAVLALRRQGQRRVHFKSESDRSRSAFLSGAITAGIKARVYVARNLPDKLARPLCLGRMLEDLVGAKAARLILESDESLEKSDRRFIAAQLQSLEGMTLQYAHCKAYQEPLLWVSDAVAWCHQKGGDWLRRAAPLVESVVVCTD